MVHTFFQVTVVRRTAHPVSLCHIIVEVHLMPGETGNLNSKLIVEPSRRLHCTKWETEEGLRGDCRTLNKT